MDYSISDVRRSYKKMVNVLFRQEVVKDAVLSLVAGVSLGRGFKLFSLSGRTIFLITASYGLSSYGSSSFFEKRFIVQSVANSIFLFTTFYLSFRVLPSLIGRLDFLEPSKGVLALATICSLLKMVSLSHLLRVRPSDDPYRALPIDKATPKNEGIDFWIALLVSKWDLYENIIGLFSMHLMCVHIEMNYEQLIEYFRLVTAVGRIRIFFEASAIGKKEVLAQLKLKLKSHEKYYYFLEDTLLNPPRRSGGPICSPEMDVSFYKPVFDIFFRISEKKGERYLEAFLAYCRSIDSYAEDLSRVRQKAPSFQAHRVKINEGGFIRLVNILLEQPLRKNVCTRPLGDPDVWNSNSAQFSEVRSPYLVCPLGKALGFVYVVPVEGMKEAILDFLQGALELQFIDAKQLEQYRKRIFTYNDFLQLDARHVKSNQSLAAYISSR